MHYGSRAQWKKYPVKGEWRAEETNEEFAVRLKKSFWIQVAIQNPWIETWCKENPGMYLFGEAFGNQDLRYGIPGGKVGFRAFDVWDSNTKSFWTWDMMRESLYFFCTEENQDNGWVAPILYIGTYSDEIVRKCTDGKSLIKGADHIREGCIVKAREDDIPGRIILKSVSNDYYTRG